MKNIIQDFFYVSKHEKVSEKKFMRNFALTVAVAVLCMASMALTAYAFYSADFVTQNLTIQSARFDCTVSIADEDSLPVHLQDGKLPAGTYTVTITRAKGNEIAVNGFCIIKIGNETYHTAQLHEEAVTFTLTLQKEEEIAFVPHWGTSSHYAEYVRGENVQQYITNTEQITVEPTPPPESDQQNPAEDNDSENLQPSVTPSTSVTDPSQESQPAEPSVSATEPAGEEPPAEDSTGGEESAEEPTDTP